MASEAFSASQLAEIIIPGRKNGQSTLDCIFPPLEDTPRPSHVQRTFQADLGTLDILPLEVLQQVLAQLDLRSFMNFQYLNHMSGAVAESVPEYKAVVKNATNALRGIISVGLGEWITCEMLFDELCTEKCVQCGDFGGFLYLLTCERVCYRCFANEKKYLPLRRSHAVRKFGINRQTLKTLPRMRSIPGSYSTKRFHVSEKILLIDREATHQAGVDLYGSSAAMEAYTALVLTRKQREYIKRAGKDWRVRRPETEDPRDAHEENPLRFMAVVRAPWLKRASQEIEWGFHCCGCATGGEWHLPVNQRLFTVSSFNEHVRECRKAQLR